MPCHAVNDRPITALAGKSRVRDSFVERRTAGSTSEMCGEKIVEFSDLIDSLLSSRTHEVPWILPPKMPPMSSLAPRP